MDKFRRESAYDDEVTRSKAFLYLIATIYVSCVAAISLVLQPFVFQLCKGDDNYLNLGFRNPGYDTRRCYHTRAPLLLFLTPQEVTFGRRILLAAAYGALIGLERRSADRPAAIRTMSLVSLGACLFSICSAYSFLSGPEHWDGARVSAAIPTGVGFLGSVLIWKRIKDGKHVVDGVKTAASLWLSAAVGISCAGELYFSAAFCIAVMVIIQKCAPKSKGNDYDDDSDDENDEEEGLGLSGKIGEDFVSMGVTEPQKANNTWNKSTSTPDRKSSYDIQLGSHQETLKLLQSQLSSQRTRASRGRSRSTSIASLRD